MEELKNNKNLKTPWGGAKWMPPIKRLKELAKKNDHHIIRTIVVGGLILLVSGSQIFIGPQFSKGASFTFTQSDWSGGLDAGGTISTSSLTGYTKYSSSTLISAGVTITLATSTATTTQTDATNSNTGFSLTGAVNSTTSVSGTGASASIKLNSAGVVLTKATIASTTYTSVAASAAMYLGSDGYPRIAYPSANNTIGYVTCTNASCSSKSTQTITWGGYNPVGLSMAVAPDGFARMLFRGQSLNKLYYLQCTNASCSTFATSSISANAYYETDSITYGKYSIPAFAVGSDGLARIAYAVSTFKIGYALCANASCSSVSTSTPWSGPWGVPSSIVLASDGYPRIATNNGAFIKCGNDSCSSISTSTFDANGNMGYSIKMASDGFPRIVYNYGGSSIKFMQCTNNTCTAGNTNTVPGYRNTTNSSPRLALDSSGLGKFVALDAPTSASSSWVYSACANASCSSVTTSTLDVADDANSDQSATGGPRQPSIALDTSDNPYIAYPLKVSSYINIRLAYPVLTYYSSGVYTSGAIDVGGESSWNTLSWVNSGGASTNVVMKARSSATGAFVDGADTTAWASCNNITSGAALSTGSCVTSGHRYIQYQATLSTTDTSVTPSLDSVSIGYVGYATSGNLISSVYDTTDPTSILDTLAWTEDVDLPSGATTTVSLRSASTTDLLSSASWTDFTASTTGCSKASGVITCTSAALPTAMKTSGSNRYFQYKFGESSTGSGAPAISNASVTFVQNAPPQFNSSYGTGGVAANQIATSTDSNFGKVQIFYSVRDTDTNSGNPVTGTPGYLTPSFQYSTNGGGAWNNITSQYLGATDLANKTVSTSTYLTYSAIWDAQSQIPGTYSASLQVQVSVGDNEIANATTSVAVTIAIDADPPTLNSLIMDATLGRVMVNFSDDSTFQFLVTNNSDSSSTDSTNASSGIYYAGVSNTSTTFNNWTFNSGTAINLYGAAKDAFGNTLQLSGVAPGTPTNMDLKDTSNPAIGTYREFLSWKLYTSTSSATFAKYELYRSTNGSSYSSLSDITNIDQNYYTDSAVSSSTTYYYKVRTVDTGGDISDYSSIVSDKPDGQGGTDFTAPIITNVSTTQLQPSWAKIIWTTDEISTSTVEYSAIDKTYGSSTTNNALVTDHSVVLENLAPGTVYYYRVGSKDPLNNEGTDNNGGVGYTFTTPGGPAISTVAIPLVSDRGATITWNTDILSDSYVVYSTDTGNLTSGTGVTTVGSATTTTAHNVAISSLEPRTKYYFYVQSTDPVTGYSSTDNNGGTYYYLGTTYDTVAPVISNISTPVISYNSTVVVWQTDELSTGQAQWGATSGSYDKSTVADNTLSIFHTALLPSLSASTKYYYKLISLDAAGNTGSSTEQNVTTVESGSVTIIQNVTTGGGGSPPPPADADKTAPVISNIATSSVGSFDAKVTFATNEATWGVVEAGENTTYGKIFAEAGYNGNSHSVSLSGLQLGTKYHYRIKAVDKSGNVAISSDQTLQTKYIAEATQDLHTIQNAEQFQDQLDALVSSVLPSLAPPFVGEVSIRNITDNSATISWVTNGKTYGSVVYGSSDEYGKDSNNPYPTEVSESKGKSADHELTLSGLTPSTLYHLEARSFVFPGVVGSSPDKTFATKAAKIQPTISNVTNKSFVVSWITEKPTDSHVEYRDSRTGKVGQVGSDAMTRNHVVQVENLTPSSGYSVKVFGKDANGVSAEGEGASVVVKKDIIAPQITSVAMSNAFIPNRQNQLQTIISWKSDEPATSIVHFEEGLTASEKLSGLAGTKEEYVLQHTVIIPSFKPGTVYRFQVESTDQAGNIGLTPIRTVVTPSNKESVVDIIVNNFEEIFGGFGGGQ